MRKLFYLLAIISAAFFVYSAINLASQLKDSQIPMLGQIKGFDNVNPNDEFNQLVEKFKQKIQILTAEAAKDQKWYFWMSFIVTALTAASTLVSSIQASKKDPNAPNNKAFAILIAILTFCSTLSNFASTHFNDLKTEETKKAADLITRRNQFFSDYDKAATPDKQIIVIRSYAREMD